MFQKGFRSGPQYAPSISDAENWFSYEYCFCGHLFQAPLDMNSTANGSKDGKKTCVPNMKLQIWLTTLLDFVCWPLKLYVQDTANLSVSQKGSFVNIVY